MSSAKQMRLLLVTPRYPPETGGVENHVYQVARRFAAAGLDVNVLTTDRGGTLPENEVCEGVKVRRVPAWPRNDDFYFAPSVYRQIRQGGWDIVHLQNYLTLVAPLAMLAAWRAKIPYVVTFHGGGHSSLLRNALRAPQRLLLRPLLRRAERLVATARFEIPFFGKVLGLGPGSFVYIPNGSDIAEPLPRARPEGREPLIASVGRLERYKGHHRILAALPHVLEKRPDVRLWIAGNGPYEDKLREMVARLGVAERVNIGSIPATDRGAMAEALSRAALVVLLSEYETHPMAALEALALGCPVLVADTSGLQELVERGWARSIPLESSPEEIAAAVLDQLHSPLIPENVELPTWDDCASGLLELYEGCLQRAG
jgi:glycosyltransferase involved in cell wall biosynthesis